MIDAFVNNKETVMGFIEKTNFNRRVLAIVFVNVQLQLRSNPPCIDSDIDFRRAFIQQGQDGLINIIVFQNDSLFRHPYQTRGESVRLKQLPVIENAFFGR